jgi:hypothetical protein
MRTKFWLENLTGKDNLIKLGIDGRIMMTWILKKYGVGMLTGLDWLGIGSCGVRLIMLLHIILLQPVLLS